MHLFCICDVANTQPNKRKTSLFYWIFELKNYAFAKYSSKMKMIVYFSLHKKEWKRERERCEDEENGVDADCRLSPRGTNHIAFCTHIHRPHFATSQPSRMRDASCANESENYDDSNEESTDRTANCVVHIISFATTFPSLSSSSLLCLCQQCLFLCSFFNSGFLSFIFFFSWTCRKCVNWRVITTGNWQ